MIEKELAQRVLIIGPDYRRPGGIATLLTHYKTMLVPFNFIATSQQVSKVRKLVVLFSALMKFLWIMCRKEITLIHIHTASNNDFRRHAILLISSATFVYRLMFTCCITAFLLQLTVRYYLIPRSKMRL